MSLARIRLPHAGGRDATFRRRIVCRDVATVRAAVLTALFAALASAMLRSSSATAQGRSPAPRAPWALRDDLSEPPPPPPASDANAGDRRDTSPPNTAAPAGSRATASPATAIDAAPMPDRRDEAPARTAAGSNTPTSPASAGPRRSDAFLNWSPSASPTRSASRTSAPVLNGRVYDDARRAGVDLLGNADPGRPGGGGDGEPGDASMRASQGYLRGVLAATRTSFVPGSFAYFRRGAIEARREFANSPAPEPTPAQVAAGNLFASTERSVEIWQRSLGPLATGIAHGAIVAMNNAHPNSPILQPWPTMSARGRATARTTAVILDVEQDAAGAIVRVERAGGSREAAVDEAAERAVRAAIAAMPQRAMPGGWRSRWLFEVSVWRDPIFNPAGMPGDPGLAGTAGVEVETDGDRNEPARVHYPNARHVQRIVRVLWSERLRRR